MKNKYNIVVTLNKFLFSIDQNSPREEWNVSRVTAMSYLFMGLACKDISGWDVSNVSYVVSTIKLWNLIILVKNHYFMERVPSLAILVIGLCQVGLVS